MAENDAIESFELKGLAQLRKAFKNPPVCRVGILGSSVARPGAGNNADIGYVHEFGLGGHPQRSFLRIPLQQRLQKSIENSKLLDQENLKKVIRLGTIKPLMQQIGVIAEGIVQEAFQTGGFGRWPAWKNPDYKNQTGMLLVDTQQLRESISSEVK